VRDQPKN
jgi:signal-transduction protein with cAMP-binding, CBS, and nucleotidyltransferase domain